MRGLSVSPVFVIVNSAAIVELSFVAYCWAFCNITSATEIAVSIVFAATGYEGPSPTGYASEDFSELGKKAYNGWVRKGITNDDELGSLARSSYKKIIGSIDDEIKNLPTLRDKAMKAFDIRNQAKDFAREASGAENKAAAEAMSTGKHGTAKGPNFDELYNKYKAQGLSDDNIYQEIINSSKRTNPNVNIKYDE